MDNTSHLPAVERLFDRAACGLLVTDPNGLIRKVNTTFCQWLGFAAEALVDKRRVQDLFTMGGRVFHQTHLMPLLQMQSSVAEVQLDMRHSDGSALPMLINIYRRREGERIFDELAVFIATDRRKYEHELVLARRNAEASLQALAETQQALQKSREVLGIALRGAKMGVWTRDLATGAVWFSSELEALAGLEEGTFAGTTEAFYALIHPADLAGVKASVDEALALVSDCSVEFRLARAGGGWTPMGARLRLACDAAGTPTVIHGVAFDITERVQAESTLMRDAAILADQSDAIVVVDGEGRILTVNAATTRMTGQREQDLIGSTLGRLFRLADGGAVEQYVAQVLAARQEWRAELGFVRFDGAEGVCESVVKPLLDRKGMLSGAVSVCRDITERQRDAARLRELNAELALADRKKDEFLATLAHELRNPLAPLGNVLEILKLKSGADAQLVWAREVFERQMRHMSHLVDDLMEISRITQGRVTLRRAPTDIGAIMRAAVEAAQAIIDGGAHRLEVLVPAAPVLVDADPTRLTQVLTNLLNNAAKYTPDGGRIWFGAAAEGGQVAISVRDSGIGIAPDNLANVFTMFAQLEPALERSQGGLGIGLALVKGLVALHDGTIAAHSAGIGQGSEFIVRLPIIAGAAAPVEAPTGPVQVEETADAGKKVLVVDDNRDGADMLRMALEMLGHEVTCAYDGKGALEGAAANRPDVVVLDIGLPDMDGYAVARAMRGQPWGKDVLLVAATGWGQQKDRDATAAAGFDIHLVKPIDFAQLDSLLRSAGATGVTHVDSLAGAVDSRVA